MSRTSQFLSGFRHIFGGFSFLAKHPSLWPWAILPWAIAFVLFVASFGLFVHHFGDMYDFLLRLVGLGAIPEAQGFWEEAVFGGLWLLKQLLKPFLFLLGVIGLSIISFLLYLIVGEPFFDLIAEKVTLLSKGESLPPFQWGRFLKSIGLSIVVALQKVGLFLIAPILLWILNWIPFFGNFLYVLLTLIFEMWVLGFTIIEYPMSQKMFPFGRRLQLGWKHKYALLGLGTPILIPFAPLLLQAPMVVGGTLLYHKFAQ